MTIFDLLPSDLKKVSTHAGGEYAGPCPWCGGEDRFRVWPENGPTGRFWCRACDRKGDGIQLARDLKGLTFLEACQVFGIDPGPRTASAARHEAPAWTPRETRTPSELWQEKAGACVEWCHGQMTDQARRFLHDRGLNDATIQAAHLGWNPKDQWRPKPSWGIEDDGKKLWIPAGLVIPCLQDGKVIRLRVRRPNTERGPRYYLLPGSDTRAMVLPGPAEIVLVVESELDAMLIHQEAGELVTVISLGNAQSRPDQAAHAILDRAQKILVALDVDQAGAKEAWQWWPQHYHQAERWPCIDGKDPGEMQQAGVRVRAWVEAALLPVDEYHGKGATKNDDPGGDMKADFFDRRIQEAVSVLNRAAIELRVLPEQIRHEVHVLERMLNEAALAENREAFDNYLDQWQRKIMDGAGC